MTTTQSAATEHSRIVDVDPQTLKKWIESGEAVVVDVREDFEHATERIPGSHHHTLSTFDPSSLPETKAPTRLVLHCRTGKRSHKAAQMVCDACGGEAFHLAGGIEAWKQAGHEVERSKSGPPIDVMRQVQITAGGLVVIGIALGYFVSPWFLIISAFVGTGLMFAGISGWCGMAKMLAAMPWNRV